MNIEITDLDMILNYLETTSLEPHDDYTSEITYKDQKILYKYIKQLQQENQQLKTNWNMLKEFLKSTRKENLEWDKKHNCEWQGYNAYYELLIKMQELEQGSDSNVKD